MNFMKLSTDVPVVYEEYNIIPTLKPRTKLIEDPLAHQKKWLWENSIFKDYKTEDDVILFMKLNNLLGFT